MWFVCTCVCCVCYVCYCAEPMPTTVEGEVPDFLKPKHPAGYGEYDSEETQQQGQQGEQQGGTAAMQQ